MMGKTFTEMIRKQRGTSEGDFQKDMRRKEIRTIDNVRALARAESAILDAKWMATFQGDRIMERIKRAFEEIHMARVEVSERNFVPRIRTLAEDEWEFNKDWYRKLESDAEKLGEDLAKLRNDLNELTYRSHNHMSIYKQICMIESEMLILQESIKTAHKDMEGEE